MQAPHCDMAWCRSARIPICGNVSILGLGGGLVLPARCRFVSMAPHFAGIESAHALLPDGPFVAVGALALARPRSGVVGVRASRVGGSRPRELGAERARRRHQRSAPGSARSQHPYPCRPPRCASGSDYPATTTGRTRRNSDARRCYAQPGPEQPATQSARDRPRRGRSSR
jgi:hypothetical protein